MSIWQLFPQGQSAKGNETVPLQFPPRVGRVDRSAIMRAVQHALTASGCAGISIALVLTSAVLSVAVVDAALGETLKTFSTPQTTSGTVRITGAGRG
jgi:hypothetical protein